MKTLKIATIAVLAGAVAVSAWAHPPQHRHRSLHKHGDKTSKIEQSQSEKADGEKNASVKKGKRRAGPLHQAHRRPAYFRGR